MCIGMCIVLFIELKFYLYINTLIQFIDSYYRTHTTKSIKNNKLNSSSLSSYDLLLRDCMTNSCRYG